MKKAKYYQIITFGCQMNHSDSQRIGSVLDNLGLQPAQNKDQADVVVINACSVRQTAIDRIWGLVNNLSKRPEVIKILTGCLLPKDRQEFKKHFDLVFDINNIEQLQKYFSLKKLNYKNYFDLLPNYDSSFSALVPIMTGCNNFCSYCAVPYVRGREISRPVSQILAEVRKLASKNYLQITLLGQNVNSYQPQDIKNFSQQNPFTHNFAKLLWEINQIPEIKRIHFTSSHPKDMFDEVIKALKLPKMVNYLHLALQSGDDEILQKMNRKYSVKDYLQIIKKVRKIKPDIAIGTDLIVGFPGETEKQFKNTLKIYKKINFDIAYIAMYSPREKTAAANLDDNISHLEKKKRWHILQDLMEKITLKKNKKYIGKKISVLVDNFEKGYCQGNSLEQKKVRFASDKDLTGQMVDVKITQAKEWLLLGKI